jgi:hypothetical protein
MPSGIRLQQLIQNQYKEILAREKNNDKFIHLYDIGAYWVAFERSACRLSGLFSKSELTSHSLSRKAYLKLKKKMQKDLPKNVL